MSRPRLFPDRVLSPAERQRRRRARLAERVDPDKIVAAVVDALDRAAPQDGKRIMARLSREIAKRSKRQR
jgi:hypothetical protein